MQFKHSLTATLVGALGLAVSGGAFAQTGKTPQDKRFYIAPMVSYGFFSNDTSTGGTTSPAKVNNDNSLGGTLAIGKPINHWLNLELYGFYFNPGQSVNGAGVGNTDLYGFGLDGLFFPARDTFPVYAVLGAAWGESNPHYGTPNTGSSAHANYLDAGVGYMYTLNHYGLKVRAEYRYRYTTVQGDELFGSGASNLHYNDNVVSLGLQIPIGKPPQASQPTPAPAPAQPQDSDGDGVIDANDQCPGTPSGTQVDDRGCPVEKKAPIVLKGVTFAFDSSKLSGQAQQRLDNVVNALEASPQVDFRIDGYTDSIGTARYNLHLSQRRVDSVQMYLTGHGVNSDRITATKGHGENDPVATNKTAAGRAQNRRVELSVTHNGDSN